MDNIETRALIEAAGGDRAFARLLGLDATPYAVQRVNNWKRRGMPPAVVLANQHVLAKLRASIQSVEVA